MVAAVAVAALIILGERRIALEIRARQIVQQHVELHAEQVLPPFLQEAEQRLLVLEQPVVTPLERVLADERLVLVEQVAHDAAFADG